MRLSGLALRAGFTKAIPTAAALRHRILDEHAVPLVIDGGASVGIFGYRLRACGYRGWITSFEPLAQPFAELERRAARDPAWDCRRLALGSRDRQGAEMHLTANSVSSSLLPISERHVAAAPHSAPAGLEAVTVTTLDSVAAEFPDGGAGAYLKLDLQGYELEALKGAERLLSELAAVELELSYVELYDGAPAPDEVLDYLGVRGFECVGIFPGFTDGHGRTLQGDAVFERRSAG
jgi:FkbM family methyltransferase